MTEIQHFHFPFQTVKETFLLFLISFIKGNLKIYPLSYSVHKAHGS